MKSRSFCFSMISNNFFLLTQFNTTSRFHLWRVHMYTCGVWGVLHGFRGSRREQAFVEHIYVLMSQAGARQRTALSHLNPTVAHQFRGWTLYREVIKLDPRSHLGKWQGPYSPLNCRLQALALSTMSNSLNQKTHLTTFLHSECSICVL